MTIILLLPLPLLSTYYSVWELNRIICFLCVYCVKKKKKIKKKNKCPNNKKDIFKDIYRHTKRQIIRSVWEHEILVCKFKVVFRFRVTFTYQPIQINYHVTVTIPPPFVNLFCQPIFLSDNMSFKYVSWKLLSHVDKSAHSHKFAW